MVPLRRGLNGNADDGRTPPTPQLPPTSTPPPAAEPKDQGDASPVSNASAAKRAQMLQQEKEFREGIERLYALSGELRDEVQKTPTLQVLSVRMYKKTEEIEKLAKQLKSKAKGG